MRFLRQSLLGVVLASVALALLVYAGLLVSGAVQKSMADDRRPGPARERVFAVNVVMATPDQVTPRLEAFGQIQSRRTLELRSAIGGRVIDLSESFLEGGSVQAGDILVRIDPADAKAARDRAESDLRDAEAEQRDAARSLIIARDELEAAQAQADLRQRAFERQTDLQTRGVATAAAVETAELAASSARQAVLARRQAVAQIETRVEQAETRRDRARLARDTAQRDLDETTLVADFSGTLSDVNLVEGRLVSANERLAKLVDTSALEVAFRVSIAQYARLLSRDGTLLPAPVEVSLDLIGGELRAKGRISRDGASVSQGQSGRQIFARLEAPRGFKPGDFVSVTVEEPELDRVVRVPASALDAFGTVLVLGEEDRLESLLVTLIRRQGDEVLIRGDGLAGREVVTGRTPLLGPGIKVRPLRPQAGDGTAAAAQEPDMLELSEERRARLVAFVEANPRLPDEVKARVLNQLGKAQVPQRLVERIESRMGG